ncbi:amino acid permease [Candidatus Micrarchaeota archaeon]|nr:amino acid permease [Candidatus Micrarchaeota archaeon]
MALARVLGLWETTLMGIGVIVGAGIYVLVGLAGQQAGGLLWLSFVIAGIIALFTAFSYAELSSMFPKASSSFFYSKKAFNSNLLSFLLGWSVIAATVIAAATVSLGFGHYLNSMGWVDDPLIGSLILLVILLAITIHGIRDSARANAIGSIAEVAGLILVISLGLVVTAPKFSFDAPFGFGGIISASVFAFFAYLGFEVLATSAEEVKNVRRTLPKAILLATGVCIILYILVAIAFTSLLTYPEIVASVAGKEGALAVAASKAGGEVMLRILGVIALFSTANTVLMNMLGGSRMLYGMARQKAMPACFGFTCRFRTPHLALMAVATIAGLFAVMRDLSLVAEATVMSAFVIFIIDNLALLQLRRKYPGLKRAFRIPGSVRGMPVVTVVAIAASAGILAYELVTKPIFVPIMLAVFGAGLLAYFILERPLLHHKIHAPRHKKKFRLLLR